MSHSHAEMFDNVSLVIHVVMKMFAEIKERYVSLFAVKSLKEADWLRGPFWFLYTPTM